MILFQKTMKGKKLSKNSSKIKWTLLAVILSLIGLGTLYSVFILNTIVPKGIVLHHSAVPFMQNASPVDMKRIDAIHQSRGFSILCGGRFYYIGYHYVILPDGTLQQGRPERCRGAHTVDYNDYIGICLIGDFSAPDNVNSEMGPRQPTPQQLETLSDLIRRLRSEYNLPVTSIYTHHELNPETECPGEKFSKNEILEQVKD
jgi:hypothetical protein